MKISSTFKLLALVPFISLIMLVACSDDGDNGPELNTLFTVSDDPISFGDLEVGSNLTRSLTITARDLTEDIVATVTGDGYGISLSEDSSSFAGTVTILADDINSSNSAQLYIQFVSSDTGSFTGTLEVVSELETASIALSAKVSAVPVTVLFAEDFDYESDVVPVVPSAGSAAGNRGQEAWVDPKGVGSGPLVTGLTMDGYPGSGVGKALNLIGPPSTDGVRNYVTDIGRLDPLENDFRTPGDTLYISFLISAASASATIERCLVFGFWNDNGGSDFKSRFGVKDEGSGILFGTTVSGNDQSIEWDSNPVTASQTYLVVMRKVVTDAGSSMSLYILDEVPAAEPENANVVNESANVERTETLVLQERQNGFDAVIDGIRIARTWSDLF